MQITLFRVTGRRQVITCVRFHEVLILLLLGMDTHSLLETDMFFAEGNIRIHQRHEYYLPADGTSYGRKCSTLYSLQRHFDSVINRFNLLVRYFLHPLQCSRAGTDFNRFSTLAGYRGGYGVCESGYLPRIGHAGNRCLS